MPGKDLSHSQDVIEMVAKIFNEVLIFSIPLNQKVFKVVATLDGEISWFKTVSLQVSNSWKKCLEKVDHFYKIEKKGLTRSA